MERTSIMNALWTLAEESQKEGNSRDAYLLTLAGNLVEGTFSTTDPLVKTVRNAIETMRTRSTTRAFWGTCTVGQPREKICELLITHWASRARIPQTEKSTRESKSEPLSVNRALHVFRFCYTFPRPHRFFLRISSLLYLISFLRRSINNSIFLNVFTSTSLNKLVPLCESFHLFDSFILLTFDRAGWE